MIWRNKGIIYTSGHFCAWYCLMWPRGLSNSTFYANQLKDKHRSGATGGSEKNQLLKRRKCRQLTLSILLRMTGDSIVKAIKQRSLEIISCRVYRTEAEQMASLHLKILTKLASFSAPILLTARVAFENESLP